MAHTRSYKYAHIFPLILQTLVWPFTWVLFTVFLRWEIRGRENLRGLKKPVIFAVNHTNPWDPILVPAALPFLSPLSPMFYTARERSFYGNQGWLNPIFHPKNFRAWGAYPVYPGLQDYETSLRHHIALIEQKKGSLCFFPEGKITRNPDGSPMKPKGGIIFIMKHTEATVIPVTIQGAYRITAKEFFMRKRRVSLTFGSPLETAGVLNEHHHPDMYEALAEELMVPQWQQAS